MSYSASVSILPTWCLFDSWLPPTLPVDLALSFSARRPHFLRSFSFDEAGSSAHAFPPSCIILKSLVETGQDYTNQVCTNFRIRSGPNAVWTHKLALAVVLAKSHHKEYFPRGLQTEFCLHAQVLSAARRFRLYHGCMYWKNKCSWACGGT